MLRSWEHRYGVATDKQTPLPARERSPALPEAERRPLAKPVAATVGAPSMCHHCEEQTAGVVCPACDEAAYCVECDTVLHRAARIRHHVRRRTLVVSPVGRASMRACV
jgi:hypothetical protein